MHLDELRDICLALPGVEETLPFGPDTLVFKVGGKVFALAGLERLPASVNLKCDPERAVMLREQYDGVTPGWHMNKVHWNTVVLRGDVPSDVIRELIDHSYALVRASLPKRVQAEIAGG